MDSLFFLQNGPVVMILVLLASVVLLFVSKRTRIPGLHMIPILLVMLLILSQQDFGGPIGLLVGGPSLNWARLLFYAMVGLGIVLGIIYLQRYLRNQ